MSTAHIFTQQNPSDAQLVSILDHNYGDGVVYIPENTPWNLYSFARKLGYISEEGYVTRKGRKLLISYKNNSSI